MAARLKKKTAADYAAQRRVRASGAPKPIDLGTKLAWDYEDTASVTGVPIGTLRRRVREGSGPKLTLVGRHHRFLPKDVQAWLQDLRDATEV